MKKITYDKTLIEKLGYIELIEKYNLLNNETNKAIFYAVSSLDKHIKSFKKSKVNVENILLGDYYSFVYYDILKNNLEQLSLLTKSTEYIYILLANNKYNEKNTLELILILPTLLLSFYNKKLEINDKIMLVENFYKKYSNEQNDFINKISLDLLLEELRK